MEKVEESEDEHFSNNGIQDEDLVMIVRKFRNLWKEIKGSIENLLRKEK